MAMFTTVTERPEPRGTARGRAAAATLAACVATATAHPTLAATEFFGGGYMYAWSDGCATIGWTGTHQILARWAPQGTPENAWNTSHITLLLPTGTISFGFDTSQQRREFQPLPTTPSYIWNDVWTPTNPRMQIVIGEGPNPWVDQTEMVFGLTHFSESDSCEMRVVLTMSKL
ncbi:MAG: hypothetical protein H6900_06170 [Rhodobacter sp.]|uniref:hypothetical protein n=1 Tax=Pararhodobacter sp. TaxID=2127056 RepID=UPI002D1F9A36|nr:hypothetical protein [Pararhodobacter sp.]MCC0072860.1 hypothetical protein [Rhodobacter sp.]